MTKCSFAPHHNIHQGKDWCLWVRTPATPGQEICWHFWVRPFHFPEVWEFTVNCLPAAEFIESYYWEAKWSKKGCTNTTNNLLGIWKLLNCGGIARKDTMEWGYVRRNQQGSDGKMIPKKAGVKPFSSSDSRSEQRSTFWSLAWADPFIGSHTHKAEGMRMVIKPLLETPHIALYIQFRAENLHWSRLLA